MKKLITITLTLLLILFLNNAIGIGNFDNGGVTPLFYDCVHEDLNTGETKWFAMVQHISQNCPPFDDDNGISVPPIRQVANRISHTHDLFPTEVISPTHPTCRVSLAVGEW